MIEYETEVAVERDKYVELYKGVYGRNSPVLKYEGIAEKVFKFTCNPRTSTVVDFGCGSGRVSLALLERGHNVVCIDFALPDYLRTELEIKYDSARYTCIEADLAEKEHMQGVKGDVGICCDVMEHILEAKTDLVLENIARAVPRCFFAIPTGAWGRLNEALHINLHQSGWWERKFVKHFKSHEFEEGDYHTEGRKPKGPVLFVKAVS